MSGWKCIYKGNPDRSSKNRHAAPSWRPVMAGDFLDDDALDDAILQKLEDHPWGLDKGWLTVFIFPRDKDLQWREQEKSVARRLRWLTEHGFVLYWPAHGVWRIV